VKRRRVTRSVWRWVSHCAAAFSAGVLSAGTLGAQSGNASVDSAAVARTSFGQAAATPTLRETLPLVQRAARAWPTQPAYWAATARIAARLSDSAAVRDALTALLAMRASPSVVHDSAVARVIAPPSFDALRTAMASAAAPVARGRLLATISDSTVFAEGIDAHPVSGALYVASIRHRTILEVRADGHVRDLGVSRDARVGALLGVRVAPDGASLYATTTAHPAMQTSHAAHTVGDTVVRDTVVRDAILRVRIADGAVTGQWVVPDDGARHLLGDLAVDARGVVYATDSYAPLLFMLRPDKSALTSMRHPLFRSLQGVAPVPGASRLLLADYSHGLLRVDLDTRTVTRVIDAPGTTSLGIDGIVLHGDAVIAVQNGVEPVRIARFMLDAEQRQITRVEVLDQQPALADEPTIGTVWRGGFVYVANSQWEKYDDTGQRRAGTQLRPTFLICVPLDLVQNHRRDTPRRQAATTASTGRKGTRNTDSAPPPSRACNVSDAASP